LERVPSEQLLVGVMEIRKKIDFFLVLHIFIPIDQLSIVYFSKIIAKKLYNKTLT